MVRKKKLKQTPKYRKYAWKKAQDAPECEAGPVTIRWVDPETLKKKKD